MWSLKKGGTSKLVLHQHSDEKIQIYCSYTSTLEEVAPFDIHGLAFVQCMVKRPVIAFDFIRKCHGLDMHTMFEIKFVALSVQMCD